MNEETNQSPLHVIDLIRKKRDGLAPDPREIAFLVTGAASIAGRLIHLASQDFTVAGGAAGASAARA